MSILDHTGGNEADLDYHNRRFLSNAHGLIKSDQTHFNGLNSIDPNSTSFYSNQNQVVTNGHASPDVNSTSINGVRISLDDKDEIQNGQLGQISAASFNCPSPQTPGGKKSFIPDGAPEGQGNSGPAVYPWMKRIHVSHGEFK